MSGKLFRLAWRALAAGMLAGWVPAANAADTVWNHNGSEMLWHADGASRIISYLHPRSGLSVVTGTVLFDGRRVGDTMEGTARIFRQGCPPAEYFVSGPVVSETEVVLYGAAPVRASSGCGISGYSTDSSNATLRFTYLRPATAADTAINRVDGPPPEEDPEEYDDSELPGFGWMSVPLPSGSELVVGIHYNVASHVMPDVFKAVLLCPGAPASGERPPLAEILAGSDGLDALARQGEVHPLVGLGGVNVCAVSDVSADLINRTLLVEASQYDNDTGACVPVTFEYSYDGYCAADPPKASPQSRRNR